MILLRLASLGAEFRGNKFVVEFLLLVGIEKRANFQIRGDHQAPAFAHYITTQLHHLRTRIPHHFTDLLALRRGETQDPVHALDQVFAWDVQQLVAVGERAHGKTDRETGHQRCG